MARACARAGARAQVADVVLVQPTSVVCRVLWAGNASLIPRDLIVSSGHRMQWGLRVAFDRQGAQFLQLVRRGHGNTGEHAREQAGGWRYSRLV